MLWYASGCGTTSLPCCTKPKTDMVGQAEDRYLAADRVTHGGVEEYAASAGGGHGSPGRGCGSPMCSCAGESGGVARDALL